MNEAVQKQPKQTAVATRPVDLLKEALGAESIQKQFQNALGEHKDAFIASLIELFSSDPALQQCAPGAIIREAMKAATLDLPINRALGFAYIVVYNNNTKVIDPKTGRDCWVRVPTPTFVPGYKGLLQLAARTGQYRTINDGMVYEGELRGTDKLTGRIDLSGTATSDRVVGYFAYIEYLNGYSKAIYCGVEEMAAFAKRHAPGIPSKVTVADLIAKANEDVQGKATGWMGNFNDMARKTLLRRIIGKYGIMSIKMQMAAAADQEADQLALNAADTEPKQVEAIDITTAEYEEITDGETGEVTTIPAAAQARDPKPTAPAPQPATAPAASQQAQTDALPFDAEPGY